MGVPFCAQWQAARAVVWQLTRGGNAWGAETLLMTVPEPRFRHALVLLRADRQADVVAEMRGLVAA